MKNALWLGILVFISLFPAGLAEGGVTLWDRMCAACHDGKTILNGKVVISKEEIKRKYRSIDELVDAVTCSSPPCMNILKHDEKWVARVGKEIGLRKVRN